MTSYCDHLSVALGRNGIVSPVQSLEDVSVAHTSVCEGSRPLGTALGLCLLLCASFAARAVAQSFVVILGSVSCFSQEMFDFIPLMDSLFFHARYFSEPCDLAPDETRM